MRAMRPYGRRGDSSARRGRGSKARASRARRRFTAAVLALLVACGVLSAVTAPAAAQQSAPGQVSSVSLSRADGTVTADWPAVSGATKYHVTYSTDGGKSWHAPVDGHTNVPTNSLTFSADNAKTYVVGVRAGNDVGWGGWRNSPAADPFVPPVQQQPPERVSSVSLSRADGTVTADWPAVSGATKYHVTYSTDGGKSWHAPVDGHTNVPTNSLTFSADNAKTYVVGVRAGNDVGWGGWRNSSAADPFVPPVVPVAPDAPSGLTATAGDASVTLNWNDPQDSSITGYEYNVNHNATSTGNLSGWSAWTAVPGSGAGTTSFTIGGLANGSEYRYHVRAVNDVGAGTGAPDAAPWFVSPLCR